MHMKKMLVAIALAANTLAAPIAKPESEVGDVSKSPTKTNEIWETEKNFDDQQLSAAGLGIWKVKGREEDQEMSAAGLGIWKVKEREEDHEMSAAGLGIWKP
ncbi:hypothetical protein PG989_015527 [Apiospora arundinis]